MIRDGQINLTDLYKVRFGIETRGSIILRNHLLDAIFAVLFNQVSSHHVSWVSKAWSSSIIYASLCPNHYPLHNIDVANLRSLTSSKRQTQIRRMPLPALLFQFVVSSFFYCFAIFLSLSPTLSVCTNYRRRWSPVNIFFHHHYYHFYYSYHTPVLFSDRLEQLKASAGTNNSKPKNKHQPPVGKLTRSQSLAMSYAAMFIR